MSVKRYARHQDAISALLLGIAGIAYAVLLVGNVVQITLYSSDFRARVRGCCATVTGRLRCGR